PLLKIRLRDNRVLTVTDGHPMLVDDDGTITVRRAEDLVQGDGVVLLTSWPEARDWCGRLDLIDLAAEHASARGLKVRVKPRTGHWRECEDALRPLLRMHGEAAKDAFRHNTIPLSVYLDLERSG